MLFKMLVKYLPSAYHICHQAYQAAEDGRWLNCSQAVLYNAANVRVGKY